jgi:alpha-glucosidase
MNYLSFLRPVWSWLRDPEDDDMRFLGDPAPIPRVGGAATVRAITEVMATQPWRSSVSGFNLLGSHDTTRFRSVCGTSDLQRVGAGLLFTFPGVPMVFAGDELGVKGVDGDGARQPMPWGQPPDPAMLETYRQLGALRRGAPALRHGGLRWVHATDDAVVYLRESPEQRLLVHVSRGGDGEPITLQRAALDGELGATLAGREPETRGAALVLPADGAGVDVWELTARPRGATDG